MGGDAVIGAGGHQSGGCKVSGSGGGSGGETGWGERVVEGTKMKTYKMEHQNRLQVAKLTG